MLSLPYVNWYKAVVAKLALQYAKADEKRFTKLSQNIDLIFTPEAYE